MQENGENEPWVHRLKCECGQFAQLHSRRQAETRSLCSHSMCAVHCCAILCHSKCAFLYNSPFVITLIVLGSKNERYYEVAVYQQSLCSIANATLQTYGFLPSFGESSPIPLVPNDAAWWQAHVREALARAINKYVNPRYLLTCILDSAVGENQSRDLSITSPTIYY